MSKESTQGIEPRRTVVTLLKLMMLAAVLMIGLGYLASRSRAQRTDDPTRKSEQRFESQASDASAGDPFRD